MQRPNGRAARIREQVHRAVIDLLADRGIDDLTVPLVAERSGVHQATIYRRWGAITTLLEDVVAAGPARTAPLPDTGSLRDDLDAYAIAVAGTLGGPLGPLMLRTAVSALSNMSTRADTGPSPVLRERVEQLRGMLDRARDRGERPPPVDLLLELVVAPIYFHALFGEPVDEDGARRLVDRLLAASRPGRPPRR
ncbi:TetR/AcrR family transcriptional regulator [Actinoplanes sp. CA-054009]